MDADIVGWLIVACLLLCVALFLLHGWRSAARATVRANAVRQEELIDIYARMRELANEHTAMTAILRSLEHRTEEELRRLAHAVRNMDQQVAAVFRDLLKKREHDGG